MEMVRTKGRCIYSVPGTEITAVIGCVCVSVITGNPQNSMSRYDLPLCLFYLKKLCFHIDGSLAFSVSKWR